MAIINVMCKLFMMVVRERINEWVEESGMLGDRQVGVLLRERSKSNGGMDVTSGV